jgi:hypothetical protein
MLLAILIPVAVLAVLVLAAVLFLQRGAGALDASPRSLVRVYLYLGSLVSLLVLVWGLSLTLTGVLGALAPDFAYGQQPTPIVPLEVGGSPARCPPGTRCAEDLAVQQRQQYERQTRENLLQGLTLSVAGALFWGVHWSGRRQLETAAEHASLLRRGYFLLGLAIFGIASIVLLPMAVYSALRYYLLPVGQFDFRQGVGDSLASALVVVPLWLLYLRIVLADLRTGHSSTEPLA